MKTKVTKVEIDTAACRLNPGEYFGLRIYAEVDGVRRMFFLRTSEAGYPGNEAMRSVLNEVVRRIEE